MMAFLLKKKKKDTSWVKSLASAKVEKKKEKDVSLLATLFSHLSGIDSSESSNRLSEEGQAEIACKQWIQSCNIEGMFLNIP